MSSLVANFNSSTAQECCKLGHDCRQLCMFTAPTRHNSTSLLAHLFRLVEIVHCRELVANSVHTADATKLDS